MKTVSFKGYKPTKLTCALFCLVIIGCLAFLDRGWIRSTALPAIAETRYNHRIQSAFNQADDELMPTQTLRLKVDSTNTAGCNLDTASGLTANISCGASQVTSKKLANIGGSQSFNQQAFNFDERIRSIGWKGGQEPKLSTPTPNSLADGVYWLSYGKKFNDIECLFQFESLYRADVGDGYAYGSLICSRESSY